MIQPYRTYCCLYPSQRQFACTSVDLTPSSVYIPTATKKNHLIPVYQPPVKLVIVELKLNGEVDDDDVGLGGVLVGRLCRDEVEGGEGGPGEVLTVLRGVEK